METSLTLERLYALRELEDAGYPGRATLMRRIHEGTLPAVKVGNAYKIRERDLGKIAQAIGSPDSSHPVMEAVDELGALVKSLIDAFPRLTYERKHELGRLLANSQ